jgi:tetratricopeptide (TPR) repeat protein
MFMKRLFRYQLLDSTAGGLSELSIMEDVLHQVEQLEKEYNWLGATESCETARRLLPEDDFSRKGDISERMGNASYRAAFQTENNDAFTVRMRQAVLSHEEAKGFYARMHETERTGKTLRVDAAIAQMNYWLTSDPQQKKKLMNECWKFTKDSLQAFEKASDATEYGRTYNQLSNCIDLGFFLEWDFKTRGRMMEEAIDYGERAIKFLSTVDNPVELARAYVKTANYLEVFEYYFTDPDEKDKRTQKAKDYLQKAREISEEAALIEVPTVLFGAGPGGHWGDGTNLALDNLAKTLDYSKKTKDRFAIGCTLDFLAYHTMWLSTTYDNRDDRLKHLEEVLHYVEEARQQFSSISFTSPRGGGLWVEGPYAQYYWVLATWETEPSKRRGFLEKALQMAPEELKRAESSGYPEIILARHWVYGEVLLYLANMTTSSERKRDLLEKALVHMDETNRISEQVEPLNSWNVNLLKHDRARVKSDLADLIEDHESKRTMLKEAAVEMETSLKLCLKSAIDTEKEGTVALFSHVGIQQSHFGGLLIRLHKVSQNNEDLQRAIEAFDAAAESYDKLDLKSRVAECFWEVARVHDDLGNYMKGAENFEAASNNYRAAAEKIPKLKSFYSEYATYTQAWSEIERARYYHEKQEYGLAEEHYEKAAALHRSLNRWNYLGSNYSAWAQVEKAENLSRIEKSEDALLAFTEAARLFAETKKCLETKLRQIEDLDEKTMAANLTKASDNRREYCLGRIALEEAKILDKRGDHYSSSRKYGEAAQIFKRIIEKVELEKEKNEFKLIAALSRAWAKMTQAEAEESPPLYLEASQLFEEARDLSPNEQERILALGHSRFCKALEVGTRFVDTRDHDLHTMAIQHLESATTYYVKAGFRNASEYAKATEQLFDAFMQVDNAKRESDPEKKEKFYAMAEKILRTSAGSFMKAEHPAKREQVLRLLEKVREERELAMSLNQVLHAPTIASATTAFSSPAPTHESAVGLERFEHANIQATLIAHQKELKIGENLDLEIELVNAGKGPALLTKITEIIPGGFELTEEPDYCRVEDSHLNMKGKRLDPLMTKEVKLVLKPRIKGEFPIKPKILYVDEDGKCMSHELEPVTITVKELGIRGWLKGER